MKKDPTLFDVEASMPQDGLDDKAANARMWEKLDELLHTAEELRMKTGIYKVLPTPELMPRIKAYFDNTVGPITAALSGVSEETRNAVLFDYAAALSGGYDYTVTLEQMQEVLRAVKPSKAFQIDRYGLYWCVFLQYSRTLRVYDEYRRRMIDTDSRKIPARDKAVYMAEAMTFNNADYFRAFEYLKNNGYATPLDFVGCNTSDVRAFLDKAQEWADVAAYGSFYALVRGAYAGTDEDIQKILPPPVFKYGQTGAGEWAEHRFEEIQKHLNQYALRVADLIDAETQAEMEKARAEVEAAEETNQILVLKEIPLLINSRPVNIAAEGDLTHVFPVQAYIDDFTRANTIYINPENGRSLITPTVVQQVFEGINLLMPYGKMVAASGRYEVITSIEELSKIVGYADANSNEKKALLGGLQLFNGLYVVVERPYRFEYIIGKGGAKKRKRVGGPTAVNVMQLSEFGLKSGELKLSISPEALRGKPVYITEKTYKQLRKQAKGANQSRFNAQLLTKGHKDENDLVAEVFGYESMQSNAERIKDADQRAKELQKVKTYIQNHRSDDKKKIAKWFQQYAADGVLTYERIKSKTGKDYYYKWTIIHPEGLAVSEATAKEPNEQ